MQTDSSSKEREAAVTGPKPDDAANPPQAGGFDVSLYLMKTRPLQASLAPASAVLRALLYAGGSAPSRYKVNQVALE